MKGLLAKEWCVTLKTSASTFILILLVVAIGVFTRIAFMFAYVALFLSVIPVNYMALDESSRWQQYALALPYQRRTIVASKYIVMLTLAAAATVITAAGLLVNMLLYEGSINTTLFAAYLSATLAVGIVLPSIAFPFNFKFGTAKGRSIMMIAMCVLASLLNMCFTSYAESKTLVYQPMSGGVDVYVVIPLILLAAAVICALSWGISVTIYEKKDL